MEERAGCFAFIVFWMSCFCNYPVALPHGAWVGLQFVIVVFPDPTHLLLQQRTKILAQEHIIVSTVGSNQ